MRAVVGRTGRRWSVTVMPEAGPAVEYVYATRAQAKFFAAVFELGPEQLPSGHRARPKREAKPQLLRAEDVDLALEAAFGF